MLRRGKAEQPLTVMEATLLGYLVRHAGETVSRKALLEEVWGVRHDTDTRTVDNFMARLRRYMEAQPARPRHLLTVRGVGYRFVGNPDGRSVAGRRPGPAAQPHRARRYPRVARTTDSMTKRRLPIGMQTFRRPQQLVEPDVTLPLLRRGPASGRAAGARSGSGAPRGWESPAGRGSFRRPSSPVIVR